MCQRAVENKFIWFSNFSLSWERCNKSQITNNKSICRLRNFLGIEFPNTVIVIIQAGASYKQNKASEIINIQSDFNSNCQGILSQ